VLQRECLIAETLSLLCKYWLRNIRDEINRYVKIRDDKRKIEVRLRHITCCVSMKIHRHYLWWWLSKMHWWIAIAPLLPSKTRCRDNFIASEDTRGTRSKNSRSQSLVILDKLYQFSLNNKIKTKDTVFYFSNLRF